MSNLVSKIARDITVSDWKPDYIVGLTRGGLIPAVMLSHYFSVPMHTLGVSLRDQIGGESNLWMAEDALDYKNILVVDDINDTGATFNWIVNDWKSGCFPDNTNWNNVWNQNVKFAVLVDNLSSEFRYRMDYVGMEINKAENNVWVDFPWEEWWAK
jgi:hypoxanthine phosphoribosyltransferase